MEDRTVFRLGAWAAIIGGILAVVVNVSANMVRAAFGPPGGGDLDDPAAEVDLALAATTGRWELIGIGIVAALLILLTAFYAITMSIEDPPAKWWARLGLGAFLLATTFGVGSFAINAGLPRGAEVIGADTLAGVTFVAGRLRIAWVIALGLAALLYGIALTASSGYPNWLGLLTMGAGLVGLVTGFMDAFAGATEVSTLVLLPISSGLLTLIVIYIGVLLFRRVSRAA